MGSDRFLNLIDKERNIYELAELFIQNRRTVDTYIDVLQDPISKQELSLENGKLVGEVDYPIDENVPNFTLSSKTSKEWEELNEQFLNYHKSLSAYTIINEAPINNYYSEASEIGQLKNVKVLDVGGGTGHVFCTFFQYPEQIEYFLVDPNLRLLHDHLIRLYPKLSSLKMAHLRAHAESLPIKDNRFDVVLNISAVDHLDDYKQFIREAYRVLKPGGKLMIASHLDVSVAKKEATKTSSKLFSHTFWERVARYLYYKKYAVGSDDHTLHLEDEKPIESALLKQGFKITKSEVFKRYFYFVAEK